MTLWLQWQRTPLHYATAANKEKIRDLLTQNNCDENISDAVRARKKHCEIRNFRVIVILYNHKHYFLLQMSFEFSLVGLAELAKKLSQQICCRSHNFHKNVLSYSIRNNISQGY